MAYPGLISRVALYLLAGFLGAAVMLCPNVPLAADGNSQPIDIDLILQDLRDLDSSLDREGDHVVGEHLC